MADEYSLVDDVLARIRDGRISPEPNVPENVNSIRPSSRYAEPNTPGAFGLLGPFSERTQFEFQPTRDLEFNRQPQRIGDFIGMRSAPNFDIPPEAYSETQKFTNRAGPLNVQAPVYAPQPQPQPRSVAAAPAPRPVAAVPRRAPAPQPAQRPRAPMPAPRAPAPMPAPSNASEVRRLWAIYNETGSPADFARASNAMRMGRAGGGFVDYPMEYANGGHVLSDDYPTGYMPHVGRQVMADGGYTDPMGVSYEPAGEAAEPGWYDKAADIAARGVSSVAEPFMSGTAKSAREGLELMRGEPGRAPINAVWQYPLGAAGFLTSPIMGAASAVKDVSTQLSGSPDIGARAGFMTEMGNPSKIAPAMAAVLPMASRAAQAAQATKVARELSPLGFYSHGAEAAAGLPQAKGTPEQYMAMLQKAGVRPAEMEYAGFQQAFAGRPSVTREEIAQHFKQKMPQIEETVLGFDPSKVAAGKAMAESHGNRWDELSRAERDRYMRAADNRGITEYGSDPKFQQYTLPGGENYREVLLRASDDYLDEAAKRSGSTAPNATDYRSQHWDEPNVLAHLRMADRTGPGGEKMLHIEEIQSDWGQAGRKEGFARPEISKQQEERLQSLAARAGSLQPSEQNELRELMSSAGKSSIPSAPYVTSTQGWTDLALKRALREAAEGGYDKMVWTPGAEQAKRYSLSNQVDELKYVKNDDGTYNVVPFKGGEPMHQIERANIPEKELESLFGRDVAGKMRAYEGDVDGNARSLSGQSLEVGGEGMKSYYDKMVPSRVKEILKKLDKEAKVETSTIPVNKAGWHVTDPSATASGKWMVKSSDYNSKGMQFDTEQEALAALAAKVAENSISAPAITITPAMREKILSGQTAFAQGGSVVERALSVVSKSKPGRR